MFSRENPKFKLLVRVALYPDGVPLPEYAGLDREQIAQAVVSCLAGEHGVAFTDVEVAIPQQHPCITAIAGEVAGVIGEAFTDVATGNRQNVTNEELRHYENGELKEITPLNPSTKH